MSGGNFTPAFVQRTDVPRCVRTSEWKRPDRSRPAHPYGDGVPVVAHNRVIKLSRHSHEALRRCLPSETGQSAYG